MDNASSSEPTVRSASDLKVLRGTHSCHGTRPTIAPISPLHSFLSHTHARSETLTQTDPHRHRPAQIHAQNKTHHVSFTSQASHILVHEHNAHRTERRIGMRRKGRTLRCDAGGVCGWRMSARGLRNDAPESLRKPRQLSLISSAGCGSGRR